MPKVRRAVLVDGPNRYDITDNRTVDPRGVHSFVADFTRPKKYKPGEPKDPFADDVEDDNTEET